MATVKLEEGLMDGWQADRSIAWLEAFFKFGLESSHMTLATWTLNRAFRFGLHPSLAVEVLSGIAVGKPEILL